MSGSAEWDFTLSITIATSAHGIASSASTYTTGLGRFFRLLPTESSKSSHVVFFEFKWISGSTAGPLSEIPMTIGCTRRSSLLSGSRAFSRRSSNPTGPRNDEKLINAAKAIAKPGVANIANAGIFENCLLRGYLGKTWDPAAEFVARLRQCISTLSSSFSRRHNKYLDDPAAARATISPQAVVRRDAAMYVVTIATHAAFCMPIPLKDSRRPKQVPASPRYGAVSVIACRVLIPRCSSTERARTSAWSSRQASR